MKKLKNFGKVFLGIITFTMLFTLTAFAAAKIYGSGTVAYTHSVASSQTNSFNWERSNPTDVSMAGKSIIDFTYKWKKGGIASADSVEVQISSPYNPTNTIFGNLKIRHSSETVSSTPALTGSGSMSLSGKLWKETISTETKLTETLLGYTTTCKGN